MAPKRLRPEDYTIGWLCALPCEFVAASYMLDEEHDPPRNTNNADKNSYIYGEINEHNVVMVSIPTGYAGKRGATQTALFIESSFPAMKIYLFVGIGGGMPYNRVWENEDAIHLGDVIVSAPKQRPSAIVEYDRGRAHSTLDFQVTGVLDKPIPQLIQAVDMLDFRKETGRFSFDRHLNRLSAETFSREAKVTFKHDRFEYPGPQYDILFKSDHPHRRLDGEEIWKGDPTCPNCNRAKILRQIQQPRTPVSHRGTIASGDTVVQNSETRDNLSEKHGVICFETEAAGVIDLTHCLVIRGISDYADSHKNYKWHDYAAATAAAYAREILHILEPKDVASVAARPLSIQANPPQASGSGITQRQEAGDGREVAAATTGDVEITDYSGLDHPVPEGPPQYEPFKPIFKRDDQY